jgi:hypothetical protein
MIGVEDDLMVARGTETVLSVAEGYRVEGEARYSIAASPSDAHRSKPWPGLTFSDSKWAKLSSHSLGLST